MAVAVESIIDMRELMLGIVASIQYARGRGDCPRTGQGDIARILLSRESLELIDARLGRARTVNREAHKLRLHRMEKLFVSPLCHRRTHVRRDNRRLGRRIRRGFLKENGIRHDRPRDVARPENHPTLRLQIVDARVEKSAPAPLIRNRWCAIGKLALVDARDLHLVSGGFQITVAIEHVARIGDVRRIRRPGKPDREPPRKPRLPREEIFARILFRRPIAIALSQIRQPRDIPRIARLSLLLALGIHGRLPVLRLFDLRHSGQRRVPRRRRVLVKQQHPPLFRERPKLRELRIQRRHLRAQCIRLLHPFLVIRRPHRPFLMTHPLEHRRDRIVVRLRDRIELVIVTTRAAKRETEERARRGAHHVMQFIRALLGGEHRIGTLHRIVRAPHNEPGRRIHSKRIASQLLPHEAIVGHIIIEGANNVVAIRPRVRPRPVHFETVALGEPHHIQPVSRPALAVVRERQQALHELFVSLGIRVGNERLDFFRRRRQPQKIETQPANQRAPIRLRRKGEILFRQFREDESIDRIAHLRFRILDRWNLGSLERQKDQCVFRGSEACASIGQFAP
ncbi:hypothetical protein CfE428DRAFT_3526 [Chthoniobacter flavus Ellin428]|uniref:Uncharacterized protein n=1 Tax=Chthoniobacter flavus Ellin428 TaxID=497964 RepID=B4D3N8_9BACT|nr:hypothetical protein [Chthoniobacter flavus]EDY18868.1 hypothetical protein CfE428DRAFT_3526 [Chthoniobacter flavus Ellin428]